MPGGPLGQDPPSRFVGREVERRIGGNEMAHDGRGLRSADDDEGIGAEVDGSVGSDLILRALDVETVEKAQEFASSEVLRQGRERAGAIGNADYWIAEEAID